MDSTAVGASHQGLLDAPVLIPEGYFQVIHGFAVALETEMAGFNDTGVDRSHGNFVNFVPVHGKRTR